MTTAERTTSERNVIQGDRDEPANETKISEAHRNDGLTGRRTVKIIDGRIPWDLDNGRRRHQARCRGESSSRCVRRECRRSRRRRGRSIRIFARGRHLNACCRRRLTDSRDRSRRCRIDHWIEHR